MPDLPTTFGIARLADDAGRFVGIVAGERAIRLDAVADELGIRADAASGARLFDHWDEVVAALGSWLPGTDPDWIERRSPGAAPLLRTLHVLPPVVPTQIFQAGANYRTHVIQLIVAQRRGASESEDEARDRASALMDERASHGVPYVFIGLPSSVCGASDDVVLPAEGSQHDWELELAVVIGARAWRVHRGEALSVVAGFTIGNDLTTRDRVYRPDLPQIGTDWFLGKNAPTFLPLGPCIVPRACVPDYRQLRLTLRLNGEIMQDEIADDMIFGVEELIEHVSSRVELLPGDVLLTGSPAGNGSHYGRFLKPGDVMEGSISGLGSQHNRCVAEGRHPGSG